MTSSERYWRAVALQWKTWDGESVVFNAASGDTHALSPTAVEVLKILENKPSAAAEISRQIASAAGLGSDEEILQQLQALLSNLDSLGLVEPI